MNYLPILRFGWHRSRSVSSRFKKIIYWVLGDPATPTQIRIIPFLLWLKNRSVVKTLDIGISHASLVFYLADRYRNAKVYGVDVVDEFLSEARLIKASMKDRYANVTILKSDVQSSLTFDTGFDLVTMFDVLEHIKDYDACLRNISDTMQVGGILAIGTPYFEDGGVPVPEEKGELHTEHIDHEWKGFSAESMGTILAKHGFRIVQDLSGVGYFGDLALRMFYFFTIDRSKGQVTDITPTYKKMPLLFLLFYPVIYVFVFIDVFTKIANDKSGHCLVIAEKVRA